MLLDELATVDSTDCEGVATMSVTLAVLIGEDTGPDEGVLCITVAKDEDKTAAVVLELMRLVLSGWTEAAIEVAAEG